MGLTTEQQSVVRAILSSIRKSQTKEAISEDERDTRDVIEALHKASFYVIPSGVLQNIQREFRKIINGSAVATATD